MPKPQAKAPSLLVDATLGALTRRLRWLGFDGKHDNAAAKWRRRVGLQIRRR